MDQPEGMPISNDRGVTTAGRLPMTPERLEGIRHHSRTGFMGQYTLNAMQDCVSEIDALRLSVAALTEEKEQVLGVLKSSEHETDDPIFAARMRMAQIEGLTERARIAEEERDRLRETWTDAKGTVWAPPTAWAYAKVCRLLEEYKARIAAHLEGVPCQECALLKQIQSDCVFSCSRCGKTVINHIPPTPVPEEASKCPVCKGHKGVPGDAPCHRCGGDSVLAKPVEAPGQFTDREREIFRLGVGGAFASWPWTDERIDSAMKSGLKPSPVAEREKVTLNELVNAYQRGYQQLDSGETNRSAQESGILAAVEALQGKALAG